MKKTLALLLAAAFLYLMFSGPLFVNNQSLAAASKFYTVANPIPNRYIVVLATTDLGPIATPTPTPKAVTPVDDAVSATTAAVLAMDLDSSSASFVAAPAPAPAPAQDPVVVATATDLTSTYGGTFSLT